MRAIWNNEVVADSDDIVTVEGNAYFPAASVRPDLLLPSTPTRQCPWKGTAHYHSLSVGGAVNQNAAWFYPDPKPAAAGIKHRIAFWKGVTVSA